MKKKLYLLCILCGLSLLLFSGYSFKEKQAVRKTIKAQFNQLKESDITAIQDYIHTQELLPGHLQDETLSQNVADIISLFYQDFSYRVKQISVKEDSAVATVKVKTMDAKTLAKDFSKAALTRRIHHHASGSQENFKLHDSYLILKELMQSNEYKTVSKTVDIPLSKKDGEWQLIHTPELDSALTGNFLEYTSNPNLLSPKEIVQVHFDAMKEFTLEHWKSYLQLSHLADTSSEYNIHITDAVIEQISHFFDYKILKQKTEQNRASVQVRVTSIDFQSILNSYQKKVSKWLKTSEALSVGASGRREKEKELFLSCIQKNEKTSSHEISIPLTNDGFSWKIQMDSEISDAIFGDISSLINEAADTQNH